MIESNFNVQYCMVTKIDTLFLFCRELERKEVLTIMDTSRLRAKCHLDHWGHSGGQRPTTVRLQAEGYPDGAIRRRPFALGLEQQI